MNKKYFLVIKNNIINKVVESEIDEKDAILALKNMFPEHLVEPFDDFNKLPKYENSYYFNNTVYDPRPYESWVIKNNAWSPPIDYPDDGDLYLWDEDQQNWINKNEINNIKYLMANVDKKNINHMEKVNNGY